MNWHKYLSYSISRKILAALLLISGAITTVITAAQLSFDYYIDVEELKNDLSRIEQGYKNGVTNSLWELNMPQLHSELEGIVSTAGIVYAEVSDAERIFVSMGKKPTDGSLEKSFDLIYNNAGRSLKLGKLHVYASIENIKSKILKKVFFIFGLQLLKTLLISFLIYLVIQSLVTSHLIAISDYLKKYDLKAIPKYLSLDRWKKLESMNQKDELDLLVDNINHLHSQLELSYSELNILNSQLEKNVSLNTKKLLEQRQQLEYSAKMSALGEMAGGIAHEINTPLATLSASIQILLKKFELEPQLDKEFLIKNLHRNKITAERIAQIVKGLKTFSRDGSQDKAEQVQVQLLVADTIALCQEKIKNNQINLNAEKISDDLFMSCQFVQTSQVLLNLINNAFDAVIDRPEKSIKIEAFEDETNTYLVVTDSGSGIPEHLRSKIFHPFFSTKELGKGTGLGLSISQSIMVNQGGRLEYDELSLNTSFRMVFPKTLKLQNSISDFKKS